MIRAMIIDDSALVRSVLSSILDSAPGIEVVGVASDPFFARDKIKKLKPDVITLDVEMPRMDGLTFLEKLMNYRPTPVVMISSLTKKGADTTLKALSLGAVDFVAKPVTRIDESIEALSTEIIEKVRGAAQANMRRKKISLPQIEVDKKITIDQLMQTNATNGKTRHQPIICVGASTGGTVAIEEILRSLPGNLPGIVIVQHMPAGFTLAFANRVNELSRLEVLEGEPGMKVLPGRAIIAPGGLHMLCQHGASGYFVEVKDGPPVNRHKPSVDVLFRSAANSGGKNITGVILTGMGDDGARGMKDLHEAGAYTIAQNERSCVVFGMPKIAIEMGGVDTVLSLEQIPFQMMKRVNP